MGTPPTTPIPNEESPLVPGPLPPAQYTQSGTVAPNNSAAVVSNVVNTGISPGPAWPGNYHQPS
jgi:hypothetical protein